jgi:hypothetical protein
MSSPAPPRLRMLEIHGRIHRTYRVRDVAECDAALRQLATWFADQAGRGRITYARIVNLRFDQDLLLDARLLLQKRGLF